MPQLDETNGLIKKPITVQHHNRIWEVKNFLSEEEVSYFLDQIESSPESEWFSEDSGAPEHWIGRNLRLERSEELIQLESKLAKSFVGYTQIHHIHSALRYREGELLGEHTDNAEPSDHDNIFGVVMYLNDDYEGGEISYTELGIDLKPSKGSLVVHDAGILHRVKPVTNFRVRYVLTSFVKGNQATKFIGEERAI